MRFIDDAGRVRRGCAPDAAFASAELLEGDQPMGRRVAIGKLLAPVEPTAILCIGLNYLKHARETGATLPQHPMLFMKNPAALCAPGDPIVLPRCSTQPEVDYECELVAVLGRDARDVPVDRALDYVAGYTVGNDVSARWWQKKGAGGQFVRGKSFDTFCPLGPVIVTADEVPDPQSLRLSTTLNGRVMQDSTTADMIFPVAQLIAELSRDTTLAAGTVLLTGTPQGVGVARDPQVFLEPGDRVTCAIDGIGELSNPVVGPAVD